MVPEGSWVDAPKEAFILGIKELAESLSPIPHTHIYFAHAYNVSITDDKRKMYKPTPRQ